MRKTLLIILCLTMCLSLFGCVPKVSQSPLDVKRPDSESVQSDESVPSAAPESSSAPAPTPTPYVEPELTGAGKVIFDGNELPGASFTKDNLRYVKLSEAVEAIGAKLEHEDKSQDFAFDWRLGRVSLKAGSSSVNYLDSDMEMAAPAIHCSAQNDLYVPVESFCQAAQIGYYYDEEYDTIYCTPASGSWQLPQGYDVPILRYHIIDWPPSPEANMIVHPESFEKQLQYLNDNGYTTIFFEDLWNIENIEKPVIITFDDGYADNFTYMYPILEKYNCKATIFVITSTLLDEPHMHMSAQQAKQLSETGLVSIQSHCVNHDPTLSSKSREDQQFELEDSKLFITRLTGKEPLVVSYPCGDSNDDTLELTKQFYRFGLKTFYPDYYTYKTGDDPTLIYRYFVQQHTSIDTIADWLNHHNEGALNYKGE